LYKIYLSFLNDHIPDEREGDVDLIVLLILDVLLEPAHLEFPVSENTFILVLFMKSLVYFSAFY